MYFWQPKEQTGFRSGYGTNDQLQCFKVLIEKKVVDYNKPLVLVFVNFKKAFDTMELVPILRALRGYRCCRIDYRYSNIIQQIYENAPTVVHLLASTKKIRLKRGMGQGDTMSPKLFIGVLECAFKTLDWRHKGVNIDGENLSHLRFADDVVL